MIFSTPQAIVRVTRAGNVFELRLPELLLVVRDRDIDRAWITLQRRAAAICGWATELGLALPSVDEPTGRS